MGERQTVGSEEARRLAALERAARTALAALQYAATLGHHPRIEGVHCPECGAREEGELHSRTCKIGAAIFELKQALAPAA